MHGQVLWVCLLSVISMPASEYFPLHGLKDETNSAQILLPEIPNKEVGGDDMESRGNEVEVDWQLFFGTLLIMLELCTY